MAEFKQDIDSFYRAKNGKSTRAYKMFINQFIDEYNWGMEKKHLYCSYRPDELKQVSKKQLNQFAPAYRAKHLKLKESYVKKHLLEKKYIYYTNDQRSRSPLFCIDIDHISGTKKADIQKCVDFLLTLHPDSYYEKSSNGKGIHFYILLDLFNYNKPQSVRVKEINEIMKAYVTLLKLYCNAKYYFQFDYVKATYSRWKFNPDRIHNIFSPKGCYELKHCGTICKLPCPEPDQRSKLYNIPFTTLGDIDRNALHVLSLLDEIRDAYSYIYKQGINFPIYSVLNEVDDLLNTNIKKGPLTLLPVLLDTKSMSCTSVDNRCTCVPTTSIMYNSMFPNGNSENINVQSEEAELDRYRAISDAFERTLSWGRHYFRIYYSRYRTCPAFEEFRTNYRGQAGTGEETEDGLRRLQSCYNHILQTFKEYKVSNKYTVGDFLQNIQRYISQEEINQWLKEKKPKMKDKVLLRDLDIGLGYYYVNLLKDKDKRIKEARSFAVGNMGMKQWFKHLKDNGQIDRGCNNNKAIAIRDLLIHIDILKCVDANYHYQGKMGVSQRFMLTPKCDKYSEFESYYGKLIDEQLAIDPSIDVIKLFDFSKSSNAWN